MPNNFPDWTGTWSDVKGFAGKTPWFTDNWSRLIDRTEDIADVIDTATAGYTTLNARHLAHEVTTTEVVAARDGYGSLLLKEQAQDTAISQKLSEATGLTQNLDGNSYRATVFANAVDPQDLTTLSQVNSLIVGGGSPGDIPITDLDVGTATANQKIVVNGTGDAIIGVDDVQDITGLEVGTATADQIIKINGLGDTVIGQDQYDFPITGFSCGTATNSQFIRVSSDGVNIEGTSQGSIGVTSFGIGSATANQRLEINSSGTGIIGVTPVRYSASRSTQVFLASGNSTGSINLTRAQLLESEYTSGCTSNTSGTNLVNLSTGVYFINLDVTFYLSPSSEVNYQFLMEFYIYCSIQSNVGFADGVGQFYSRNGIVKKEPAIDAEYVDQIPRYVGKSTQRIVNVASAAIISFNVGAYWRKRLTSNVDLNVYLHSSNISVFRI